jgi:hypothetical protein
MEITVVLVSHMPGTVGQKQIIGRSMFIHLSYLDGGSVYYQNMFSHVPIHSCLLLYQNKKAKAKLCVL